MHIVTPFHRFMNSSCYIEEQVDNVNQFYDEPMTNLENLLDLIENEERQKEASFYIHSLDFAYAKMYSNTPGTH